MNADVYVLKFATFDVTGLDGRYEIAGVPAGEATVNTLLPALSAIAKKKVRLAPNETLELDFELHFDRKEWAARRTSDAGATPRRKRPDGAVRARPSHSAASSRRASRARSSASRGSGRPP